MLLGTSPITQTLLSSFLLTRVVATHSGVAAAIVVNLVIAAYVLSAWREPPDAPQRGKKGVNLSDDDEPVNDKDIDNDLAQASERLRKRRRQQTTSFGPP